MKPTQQTGKNMTMLSGVLTEHLKLFKLVKFVVRNTWKH